MEDRLVPVPRSSLHNNWLTPQMLVGLNMEVFCKLDRLYKVVVSLDSQIEIGEQGNQQVHFVLKANLDGLDEYYCRKNIESQAFVFFNIALREKLESIERSVVSRGNLDKTSNLLIKY